MPTDKVTIRTAVITGSTRGLGRELARGLAENGWQIAGCSRSADSVRAMAAELGGEHLFKTCDVASDQSVADFANASLAAIGAPDLLINNAAIINDPAPLWEVSASEFDQVTAVNINGSTNVIRHFVPAMIERGSGVIVNFSSGWGRSTSPDVAPYCATKWAIEGLTDALAQELPRGLAAVALNPGVIDTEMLRQTWDEGAGAYEGPQEWGKRAVPFFESLSAKDNGAKLTAP